MTASKTAALTSHAYNGSVIPLTLTVTGTGHAVLVDAGKASLIPDRATYDCLKGLGLPEQDEVNFLADNIGALVPMQSLAWTGLIDSDDELYWMHNGTAYQVAAPDRAAYADAFGPPTAAAAVLPAGIRSMVLDRARPALSAGTNAQDILAYLQSIHPPAIAEPPGLNISTASSSTNDYQGPGNVAYSVTSEVRDITNVIDSFPVVTPIGDALWPGAIIQGATLSSGLVGLVQIGDRAPGSLTIATELVLGNPDAPTSTTVDVPSQSSGTTARRQMMQALDPRQSTGSIALDIATVSSEQQVSTRLGVNVSGSGWQASGNVNVAGSLETSVTMLRLTQEFYSVTFDPSGSPAEFFGNSVTADMLKQYSGPNNAPCYINEVTYGRIFLLKIESSDTASMVDAQARASWKATVSGDVNAQAHFAQATKAYRVSVATVGITGATFFRAVTSLGDALKAISDSADYSSVNNPGGIIAYSARYLLDGTIARAVLGPFRYTAFVRCDQPTSTSYYHVYDGAGGYPGGFNTGIVIRPGDHVSITATGSVWAGWWFGGWFGPEGDISQHGKNIGNGTKPMFGTPFSALIYGFGQGWFYWAASHEFTYGQTTDPANQNNSIGSATTPLPLIMHLNDDNVKNGAGGFYGQIVVLRRLPAAVSPT